MNTNCENPGCENPAIKEVPVSIERLGDQVRSLCAACEEVYAWGVQHGTLANIKIQSNVSTDDVISQFLQSTGFVLLAENQTDPGKDTPFEAWAYEGPLDFSTAQPVTFGSGKDVPEALDALAFQLTKGGDDG